MAEFAALQNMPMILKQLPEFFFLSDVLFYVFGALFFGSIAMRGFRGHMHFAPHFAMRVVMGIASIVGGVALQGFFPSLNQGIYQLFRVDLLAGALVSSIIFAVGLYLISFRMINVNSLKKLIRKLQERIEKSKKIPSKRLGWKDPLKIAGVLVVAGFLVFSLINFSGFPRISDSFLSFVGLSQEDLTELSKQLEGFGGLEGEVPEGCESIVSILTAAGPDITKLPVSTDETIKSIIEKGSGSEALVVWVAEIGGKDYFIAQTGDSKICSATKTKFCSCLDASKFVS